MFNQAFREALLDEARNRPIWHRPQIWLVATAEDGELQRAWLNRVISYRCSHYSTQYWVDQGANDSLPSSFPGSVRKGSFNVEWLLSHEAPEVDLIRPTACEVHVGPERGTAEGFLGGCYFVITSTSEEPFPRCPLPDMGHHAPKPQ